MCYSATASFSVAAALTVVGGLATYHCKGKTTFVHSTIPLLFAFQQAVEGFVWITMGNPNLIHWHYLFGYIFIFFAFLLWPIMIPASLLLVERKRFRRNLLSLFTLTGIFISASMVIVMILCPLEIGMDSGHIQYSIGFTNPLVINIYLYLYAIATILPFLTVTTLNERLYGLILLASLLLCFAYLYPSFISTWCYFAAIVSAMILLVVYQRD